MGKDKGTHFIQVFQMFILAIEEFLLLLVEYL